MGFSLTVEGSNVLTYGKDIIQSVQTGLSSPGNSRAKAANAYATMWITGKLHADGSGSLNSETIELFRWAQLPPAEEDVYRSVTAEIAMSSACFRKITFDKAFVVDYSERYSASAGVGEFSIVIRQKADKVDDVLVEGGMPLAGALGDGGNGGEEKKRTAMGKALDKVGEVAASTVKSGILQSTLIGAGSAAAIGAVNYAMKKKDPTGVAAATLGRAITEVTTFTNQKVGTPSKTAAVKAAKAAGEEKTALKSAPAKATPVKSARRD